MRSLTTRLVAVTALAFAVATTPGHAQSPKEFYGSNRLTFIVAASAGGGYDLYSRVLMNHFPKHLPGNPSVVVQNMPGAGGVKAANYMYNVAAQDGSVIGMPIAPVVLGEALRPNRAKYSARKFGWIGTITTMTDVLGVFRSTGVSSIEQAKQVEVVVGATGKLASNYLQVALINAILGTKFKIVQGYKSGNEMNIAMDRKEVMGRTNQWTSWRTQRPHWIERNEINFLVQFGPKNPELAGVPGMLDLVADPEMRDIIEFMELIQKVGRSTYAPPGVPPARLAALRDAFDATVKDPAFLNEAKERHLMVNQSRRGKDLAADLDRILPRSRDITAKMEKLLRTR